jgi:small-conductance mechanosensitive channel
MQVNILNLVLYLGLYALAALMLSRAWRIGKRNRLDLVANWSNKQLENPERYKPHYITINLVCGIALLALAVLVLAVALPFSLWVSLAALIFWGYFFIYHFMYFTSRKNAANEAKAKEKAAKAR